MSSDRGETWFSRVSASGDPFHFAAVATDTNAYVMPGFCLKGAALPALVGHTNAGGAQGGRLPLRDPHRPCLGPRQPTTTP